MDPVSARLLNQQMICPRFTSPHDGWGLCSGDLYALKQSYALVEKKLTSYRHRDSRPDISPGRASPGLGRLEDAGPGHADDLA